MATEYVYNCFECVQRHRKRIMVICKWSIMRMGGGKARIRQRPYSVELTDVNGTVEVGCVRRGASRNAPPAADTFPIAAPRPRHHPRPCLLALRPRDPLSLSSRSAPCRHVTATATTNHGSPGIPVFFRARTHHLRCIAELVSTVNHIAYHNNNISVSLNDYIRICVTRQISPCTNYLQRIVH